MKRKLSKKMRKKNSKIRKKRRLKGDSNNKKSMKQMFKRINYLGVQE